MSTQAVQPPEKPSDDRITLAEYFDEIIKAEEPTPQYSTGFVQRVGSSDVLMWGQETSYKAPTPLPRFICTLCSKEILFKPPDSISQLKH